MRHTETELERQTEILESMTARSSVKGNKRPPDHQRDYIKVESTVFLNPCADIVFEPFKAAVSLVQFFLIARRRPVKVLTLSRDC